MQQLQQQRGKGLIMHKSNSTISSFGDMQHRIITQDRKIPFAFGTHMLSRNIGGPHEKCNGRFR
jgi:hypothetical protein